MTKGEEPKVKATCLEPPKTSFVVYRETHPLWMKNVNNIMEHPCARKEKTILQT